jgi:hypothetical protein
LGHYKRRPGGCDGLRRRSRNVSGKRAVRLAVFDTTYWKSFVHAHLAVPMGDCGCLCLFGGKPREHRLGAEHLTAEYRMKAEGRGRTLQERKQRAKRGKGPWFDSLVDSSLAAWVLGRLLFDTEAKPALMREHACFRKLQRTKRA